MEDQAYATAKATIGKQVGGRMFLLIALFQAIVLVMTFFGLASAMNGPSMTFDPGNDSDYQMPKRTLQEKLGLDDAEVVNNLFNLVLCNLVFCATAWWFGRSAGRAILGNGKNFFWVGPVWLIAPSLLAAIVGTITFCTLEEIRHAYFSFRVEEDILLPIGGLFAIFMIASIFSGMLAGSLTKIFGRRRLELVEESAKLELKN